MAKTIDFSLTGYFKEDSVNDIPILNAASKSIDLTTAYKKTSYSLAADATETVDFDDIVNAKVAIVVVRTGKVNVNINSGDDDYPCASVILLTADSDTGYITALSITEAASATATVDVYIGG